jgi:hypothetical protein
MVRRSPTYPIGLAGMSQATMMIARAIAAAVIIAVYPYRREYDDSRVQKTAPRGLY